MKTNSKLLADFIMDFDLENNDGSVCFTADIEFHAEGAFKKTTTEIHLITLRTGLSVLYLLGPVISEQHIPDLIPYYEENFFYRKTQFLTIRGLSYYYGNYTLFIYPVERRSYLDTMKLSQKVQHSQHYFGGNL